MKLCDLVSYDTNRSIRTCMHLGSSFSSFFTFLRRTSLASDSIFYSIVFISYIASPLSSLCSNDCTNIANFNFNRHNFYQFYTFSPFFIYAFTSFNSSLSLQMNSNIYINYSFYAFIILMFYSSLLPSLFNSSFYLVAF